MLFFACVNWYQSGRPWWVGYNRVLIVGARHRHLGLVARSSPFDGASGGFWGDLLDAGVGTASDACLTMEQGVDGILMNTALAEAQDPAAMGTAMRCAVDAGRLAYLAGRMPRREVAVPSSPDRGMLA